MRDVHTEHCCKEHGCKYGSDDRACTVANGTPQSFPCEQCEIDNDTIMKPLYNYAGKQTETNIKENPTMGDMLDAPVPTDVKLLTDISEMLARPRRLEDGELKAMRKRIWERLKYVQPGD